MGLAREGIREMLIATAVAGVIVWGLASIHPAAALPVVFLWAWVICFFRDPARVGAFAEGEMCAPADGKVTEVTRVDYDETIGGPAVRIGIFLGLLDVHINRAPCAGRVRHVRHQAGQFLDARHRDSGLFNESNTLLIDADAPLAGPVIVRQVAGLIARRIVCHARSGTALRRGQRFGMIKFGSRTELIAPYRAGTDIAVRVGDRVKAGLTVLLRQAILEGESPRGEEQARESDTHRREGAPV